MDKLTVDEKINNLQAVVDLIRQHRHGFIERIGVDNTTLENYLVDAIDTMREVEALKHDVSRYMAIANEYKKKHTNTDFNKAADSWKGGGYLGDPTKK